MYEKTIVIHVVGGLYGGRDGSGRICVKRAGMG